METDHMTDKEKMLNGDLYFAGCKELERDHDRSAKFMREYNDLKTSKTRRKKLIKKLFKSVGQDVTFSGMLQIDYGPNITIGDHFYANFDTILLDVNEIVIGNNVMFGPRVGLYTAGHPVSFQERNSGLEYGKKIVIGDNCWLGGNVVVNPGVTIGSGTVVASGAVVTKDLPANVIAGGVPCKVIRKITEADRKYWKLEIERYRNS